MPIVALIFTIPTRFYHDSFYLIASKVYANNWKSKRSGIAYFPTITNASVEAEPARSEVASATVYDPARSFSRRSR